MKKMHYRVLVVTLLCVFFNTYFSSAQTFDSTLAARLQFAIDSIRIANNYKGVSVAVIVPYVGTWLGASGVSHDNINITPGMKFCATNCTQTFVAMLILKLAEMNVLSLDDSLSKWLPDYQYVDSTITIRQLLNHSSGLYNFNSYPGYWDSIYADPGRLWEPDEILNDFLMDPICSPGSCELYSNTNYLLAGKVIEAATNYNVATLIRQYFLDPLNYESTFFAVEEPWQDTIAHEWINNVDYSYIDRTSRYSAYWTSKSMFSTAENMARMYMDLFNGEIISQSSLDQMLNINPPNFNYGLGIENFINGEDTVWYQLGSSQGYNSSIGNTLHPLPPSCLPGAINYSVAVLINQAPSHPEYFGFKIGDIVDDWVNFNCVPVELVSFSGNCVDRDVALSWITATETNDKGFEIQRSINENNFTAIGFVEGNGTTTESHAYSYTDKNLSSGKYYYRLKQIDFDGSYEYSDVVEVTVNVPIVFSLKQNYPNPFNPSTIIKYSIPEKSNVTLKVFDILGSEVRTLVDEVKPSGTYELMWNAANLPSGVFFYQIKAGRNIETKKMVLIK